jgi:HD-GYP domain-containing protein (c-di-GMP phosphodiesterase class II)
MPLAIDAYEAAVATVGRVQRCIQENGAVDVDDLARVAGPLVDSVLRNPGALAWFTTLTKKHDYAYDHSVATSVWTVLLGRHLKLGRSSLETLALGGMLLDIGMVFVSDEILAQQGELSEYEKDQIFQHVYRALDLLDGITGIGQDVLDMVAFHHERLDRSGYPVGYAADDIPVFGQIAALADCYDAMISDRDHAAAIAPHEAMAELNRLSGTKFDPYLTRQFIEAIGLFPSGSLVELNSGEVGLVVEQNGMRRLRPKILVLLNQDKQPVGAGSDRSLDLDKVSSDSRAPASRWIVKGLERRYYNVDPANFFV